MYEYFENREYIGILDASYGYISLPLEINNNNKNYFYLWQYLQVAKIILYKLLLTNKFIYNCDFNKIYELHYIMVEI